MTFEEISVENLNHLKKSLQAAKYLSHYDNHISLNILPCVNVHILKCI